MRRTRHVVLPVRSWQHVGLMIVSLACLTLGLVSRDREGQAGNLAGPDLQHCAPHKVDACPNKNVLINRRFYDDSALPSGIILSDQSNQHRRTKIETAPENRGIRDSRSSLRVSRFDISRLSLERRDARLSERRDERRSQSLNRRSSIGNSQRRVEERTRESRIRDSLSVDRNSRLLARRVRERDSISSFSSRNDRTISETGADRRARRIRTSEPLQRNSETKIDRLTTNGDREDRQSRRGDSRSLKREIVNRNSKSYQSIDRSVQRRDDQRNRKVFVGERRDSVTLNPRRPTTEQRNLYRSDRRLVRDTREIFATNRNERSIDRVNGNNRVPRVSLARNTGTGSSRLRIAEERDEQRVRDVRNSHERDSTIKNSRVRDIRSAVKDSTRKESRSSKIFERNLEQTRERRNDRMMNRQRFRETNNSSQRRNRLDNSATERREDKKITTTEIRNRIKSTERDSKAENRYERSEKRTRRSTDRSSMIRTSLSTNNEFPRTNSLRNTRDIRRQLITRLDRIRGNERSSNTRLNNPERSDSRRRTEVKGIIDHVDSQLIKEDTNRFESRSRFHSSIRRSEPLSREARFIVTKVLEERFSSSSSIYYERLKQTVVLVLSAAYGISLYGGKGSISRNIMTYANRRFIIW